MLSDRSKQVRRDTIALSKANGGYHYGGCFSVVEMLIALFDNVLRKDDRFILSKGHSCWPLYVLLREKGLNPKLEGHPHRDPHNGIYCTTGSLGHGLPTGVGTALAKKIKKENGVVYVLMGDGECQEGTTWESMHIASAHKLGNLVAMVDYNRIQGYDFVDYLLPVKNLSSAANVMGWEVFHIDGHSIEDITYRLRFSNGYKPKLIIAHTVKGKGVSFMEGDPKWHANWLDGELEQKALEELQ